MVGLAGFLQLLVMEPVLLAECHRPLAAPGEAPEDYPHKAQGDSERQQNLLTGELVEKFHARCDERGRRPQPAGGAMGGGSARVAASRSAVRRLAAPRMIKNKARPWKPTDIQSWK
jgi:hypothetical protein